MSSLLIVALPLILLPLAELWLLIQVGSWIGAFPTLLLCLGSAALGVTLVRHQGFAVMGCLSGALAQGEPVAQDLLDGALLLLAGLLLLIPGLFSDLLGLVLLIPPLRRLVVQQVLIGLVAREVQVQEGRTPEGVPSPRVIEGEYRREPD